MQKSDNFPGLFYKFTKYLENLVEQINRLAAALTGVSRQAADGMEKSMESRCSIAAAMNEVAAMARRVSELLESANRDGIMDSGGTDCRTIQNVTSESMRIS